MALTPQDIDNLTFSPSKHGYDTEEVDNFLEQLSSELDAMLSKIADLKGRLNSSEAQLAQTQAQLAQAQAIASSETVVAAPAPVAAPAEPEANFGASERQISQVLIVAQQSADKIVADARENADRIRTEADQKAREVIRQALAEKQAELDEIDRLKTSREEFRSEYKNLLQHFMDDADTAFPNSVLTSPTGSRGTTHETPAPQTQSAANPIDANATVYAQVPASATTVNVDDLD